MQIKALADAKLFFPDLLKQREGEVESQCIALLCVKIAQRSLYHRP
jgi:hypothetical protein